MLEHKVIIENKKGGKIEAKFHSPSYYDWECYNNPEDVTDPKILDYLCSKYLTMLTLDGEDIELDNLQDLLKIHIVNAILESSSFSSPDDMHNNIVKFKDKAKRITGAYDYFLWLNLDFGSYLSLLDVPEGVRFKVIANLELTKGIDIRKRFEFSVQNNEALELDVPDNRYYKTIETGRPRASMRQNLDRKEQTDRLESARQALDEEFARAKQRSNDKKVTFDWQKDAQDFGDFDKEPPLNAFELTRKPPKES